MAQEKPDSSLSEHTKARDRKNPSRYFRLSDPESITAARPPQVKSLTRAVQRSSVQRFNKSPPQSDATAVASDGDALVLDYTEGNMIAPLSVVPRQEIPADTIKRKRALSDKADIATLLKPDKVAKVSTNNRGITSAGALRRKVLDPASDIQEDGFGDVHEGLEGPLQIVEAQSTSIRVNEQNQELKSPHSERIKDTSAAPPITRILKGRKVGKHVKIQRHDLLELLVKPAIRLHGRPRFRREACAEENIAEAVVQEAGTFLDILEPGLPGLKNAKAFSRTFQSPANLDAKIAKGLKATAAEIDPEESFDEIEESEDDESNSIEATKESKRPDAGVVYNGLDRSLPPINTLPDIFEDMVQNGWELSSHTQLRAFVEHIQGTKLKVGTMCSGTECPVLALGLINDGQFWQELLVCHADSLTRAALTRLQNPSISFIHVLSCEIKPYKQAYIQRNFDPRYLFRDVTELSGNQASTAYGSAVEVPGNLDILIAGSSCVDYSLLNNNQKKYGEEGQSVKTFQGVLGYLRRYTPRIVLLENVKNAPWIKLQLDLEGVGYETFVAKVDTKNFYLPQTRERGYMIAFNRTFAAAANLSLDSIGEDWANAFDAYSRRASSPFTNFIYPEDDPRLDQLRRELIISQSLEKPTRKAEWQNCRHRYVSLRAAHGLGFRRPVTMWENNGSCKFPDGSWLRWAKGQVERIWDTIDISHLRCVAQRDYDNRWKTRAVELSQNIDRDVDPRAWGIIGCITPSGMPYLTTRGGPITGPESLALQGIPTNKLSLTYETAKQLQDFAGNAMTSTVVAAAMLAAFGVGHKILERGPGVIRMLSERSDIPFSELTNDGTSMPRREEPLPVKAIGSTSFSTIQEVSSITMQLCSCEGRFGCSPGPLQHCLSCGHTTCTTCGQNPLHKYEPIPKLISDQRSNPSNFEIKIKKWLPLQLQFDISDNLASSISRDPKDKVMRAIRDAFNDRLHLTDFSRTKSWTAKYESSYARLDIVFIRKWATKSSSSQHLTRFLGAVNVQVYLYAKAPATESVNSRVRAALTRPIARMTCRESIHDSGWQIRIPEPADFTLDIIYSGRLVDSWEANLGLQDKIFRDRQVTKQITLSYSAGSDNVCPQEIPGVYELLSDCDSACRSLHRKLEDDHFGSGPRPDPVFFFLDPGFLCNAAQDSLVFATTHHRLPLGGERDILAQVKKGWRLASSASDTVPCTVPGKWRHCGQTHLKVPDQRSTNIKISVPVSGASAQINIGRCTDVDFTALVCSFPLRDGQHKQWMINKIYSIDVIDKVDALRPYTQLVQRAGQECGFEDWAEIVIPSSAMAICQTCAPARPRLVFPTIHFKALVTQAKAEKPLLVEDQHQAFEFEKRIKARPSPVVANLHCHKDNTGKLQLQLNVATLVHRAYGKLVGQGSKSTPHSRIHWRLAKDSGFEQLLPFPKLSLQSNSEDLEFEMPPNWVDDEELRLHLPQLKSLRWMLKQECDEATSWVEEEIEEARIPAADLRLDVKIECPCHIRGGILADEVGYGKTAVVVALFDSDASDSYGARRLSQTTSTTTNGKIKIKATLVLAPADLLHQWHSEIQKFLRKEALDRYVILRIDSEKLLKNLSVKDICDADLILSTWEVFGDWYLEELAYLGRSPQLPKCPGRAFQQWVTYALKNLGTVVAGSEASEYEDYRPTWRTVDLQEPGKQESDVTHQELEQGFMEEARKALDANFRVVDIDERDYGKIAPLFHLFCFRRVVTDEFTYVQGKDLSLLLQLDASRKWALSGTPPLGSFREVNNMALLVGTKLSNDDNDGGLFESRSILKEKMKDKTLAEEFHFYSHQTRRSPSWYQARHELCRKFLRQFVRQNPADLTGVELLHHYEVIDLAAAERATYFELFQMLMSQPLVFKPKEQVENTRKAAGSAKLDRTERLRRMASGCRSPEEALLICCSTSMSSVNGVKTKDRSARKVCEGILAEQEKHFIVEAEKLYEKLTGVLELWKLGHRDDPEKNPHFYSFIRSVDNNIFGDPAAKAVLEQVMGYAYTGADETAMNRKTMLPQSRELPVLSKALSIGLMPKDKIGSDTKKFMRNAKTTGMKDAEKESKGDESDEESAWGSTEESGHAKASAAGKVKTERGACDLKQRKTFMFLSAAVLTNLSLRIVERLRGLRFQNVIFGLVNAGGWPLCSSCGKKPGNVSEVLIMGLCGHTSCVGCFEAKQAQRSLVAECVAQDCEAPARRLSAFPLSDLNANTSDLPHPNGSKIEAVLNLLQDTNRVGTGDHIVIFVHSHRLKLALIEALKDKDITYLDGSKKKAVESFKDGRAKICILDPESVNAAGWNLQIANHVIFLSSLVVDAQYRYESIYEQAIGRVYRRGQKKGVHVYHFLAARTIDVNILEAREDKTLVQRGGKYLLLTESDIQEGDRRNFAGASFEGAACGIGN